MADSHRYTFCIKGEKNEKAHVDTLLDGSLQRTFPN